MEEDANEKINNELNILGSQLLKMNLDTLGDTKNFLIGVNNVASQLSSSSILLSAMSSTSIKLSEDNNILTGTMKGIDIASMINIPSPHLIIDSGAVKLARSVTSVLAYGQAVQSVQTKFLDTIYDNSVALQSVIASNPLIDLKSVSYAPYISPISIAFPSVFSPQEVKTKEITKKFPEIKKDLPAKTTEAIELMEYVFNPDTKNDDQRIVTTVAELKRAVKNIQGSVSMFIQQTTHKVEITSMPIVQAVIEKSTSHANKFPLKIPAGTTWQNIIIQFTDSNYVNIQVAGHSHPTGYADMGFVDKRTSKPTIQWTLLSLLAKGGGELPNSSIDASDNYKKHKQLLSEKLRCYFNIESDPFEPYKGGYKTRMTLVPPPVKKGESKNNYSITDEVENMFRDLTEE